MIARYTSLRDAPSPKKEYVLDYSSLYGGVNLWDPDYRLKPSESPEMKNLLWRNGMLCSRKGQFFLNSTALGRGYAAFPRFWHGCIFAHIGDGLYSFRILPSPHGQRSVATVVNEMPVASQSRGVTEPQREGDRRYATVDEVFPPQRLHPPDYALLYPLFALITFNSPWTISMGSFTKPGISGFEESFSSTNYISFSL